MNLTNDGEALVLEWLLGIGTPTRPSALYLALHTEDPTETGSAGEVTTSLDALYERKLVTLAGGSGSQRLNDVAVSWTVDSASAGYTVTHASLWTAATGGTVVIHGELGTHRPLVANGVLTFNIGDITISAD